MNRMTGIEDEVRTCDDLEPLLTGAEVAFILGVSPATVASMAKRGELPTVYVPARFGGVVTRFEPSRLAKWVREFWSAGHGSELET